MTTPAPALPAVDLAPLRGPLTHFQQILAEVGDLVLEREDAVRAAGLALLTRQHPVFIGPPGTAKSMLVTELAARINPPTGGGTPTFLWLMTRFTTPAELFGPVSVQGLKADQYRRVTAGKLPEAPFVFLDEVYSAPC